MEFAFPSSLLLLSKSDVAREKRCVGDVMAVSFSFLHRRCVSNRTDVCHIIVLVDRQTSHSHVPTSVLAPTTVANVSSMKPDHADDYPQRDLNLNLHHHTHLAQQRLSLDQNDDDDDDDDDDDVDVTNNQNTLGNGDGSNR